MPVFIFVGVSDLKKILLRSGLTAQIYPGLCRGDATWRDRGSSVPPITVSVFLSVKVNTALCKLLVDQKAFPRPSC